LDPFLGFGGDGAGRLNCIQDGPFADYINPIGPGYELNDHCIDRQVSDDASLGASSSRVENCMDMTVFTDFWPCIEAAPHTAGHGGIGAQVRTTPWIILLNQD
jgi:tyrosinase